MGRAFATDDVECRGVATTVGTGEYRWTSMEAPAGTGSGSRNRTCEQSRADLMVGCYACGGGAAPRPSTAKYRVEAST